MELVLPSPAVLSDPRRNVPLPPPITIPPPPPAPSAKPKSPKKREVSLSIPKKPSPKRKKVDPTPAPVSAPAPQPQTATGISPALDGLAINDNTFDATEFTLDDIFGPEEITWEMDTPFNTPPPSTARQAAAERETLARPYETPLPTPPRMPQPEAQQVLPMDALNFLAKLLDDATIEQHRARLQEITIATLRGDPLPTSMSILNFLCKIGDDAFIEQNKRQLMNYVSSIVFL